MNGSHNKQDQLHKSIIVLDEAHLMYDYNLKSIQHYEFPDVPIIQKLSNYTVKLP